MRIQALPSGLSMDAESTYATMKCAMKVLNTVSRFFRLTESTNTCETSYNEKNTTDLTYRIKTHYNKGNSKDTVTHHVYDSVEDGTAFEFRVQKMDADGFRFWIYFQINISKAVLVFNSNTNNLTLHDVLNDTDGEVTVVTYPFNNLTEYKLKFVVIQNVWQIYIDDTAFETFAPRQDSYQVKQIKFLYKYGVIYHGMTTNGSS